MGVVSRRGPELCGRETHPCLWPALVGMKERRKQGPPWTAIPHPHSGARCPGSAEWVPSSNSGGARDAPHQCLTIHSTPLHPTPGHRTPSLCHMSSCVLQSRGHVFTDTPSRLARADRRGQVLKAAQDRRSPARGTRTRSSARGQRSEEEGVWQAGLERRGEGWS